MFTPPRGSTGGGGTGTGTGDMLKAMYDVNDDGIVDFSQGVDWSRISNIPLLFTPSAHTHSIVTLASAGFIPALPGDPDQMLNGMGNWITIPTATPGLTEVRWGDIIGSLSNQVDLIDALNAKVPITRTINGQPLSANVTLAIPITLSELTDDATHRLVTDTEKVAWNGKQNALGYTPENVANKNQPNGYAGLDGTGKIDTSLIPAISAIGTITSGTSYPASPAKGDVCIRTDLSKTYIYSGSAWLEMITVAGIQSVNGKTESVITLNKSDIGLDQVGNYESIHAITTATIGRIPVWADTGTLLGTGFNVATTISSTPSDTTIPTEKAVRDLVIAHRHALATPLTDGLIPATPDNATYFLNGKNQWSLLASVTGGNVGTGAGLFLQKSGGILQFKSIRAGTNVSITENSNEIIISSTGGSGTSALWGGITGILTDQTDLITELNKYVPKTRTVNGQPLTTDINIVLPVRLSDLLTDSTHKVVTDVQIAAWSGKQDALGFTPENVANKGIANGYVPLGADSKVSAAFLNAVSSINGKTGIVTLTPADLGLAFGDTYNTIARGDHNHDAKYLGITSKAIDSDKLNGLSANNYSLSTHDHGDTYLGLHAKADNAVNADNLNGHAPDYFAISSHNHDGNYLSIAGKAADSDKLDGKDASDFAAIAHTHSDLYQPVLGFTPENTAYKGAANGYVPLNALGKIPAGFLDAIELTDVTVGTAYPLTPSEGDICIRTDLGVTYIYDGVAWIELLVPTGYVQSVNGKTGSALTLLPVDLGITFGTTAGKYAEGNHSHTGVYLPINGTASNSELFDGHDTDYFAQAGHVHTGLYLGINDIAADSELLEGHAASYFSISTHAHAGTYQPVLGFTAENVANKGSANGYAPLVNSLIPLQYLPTIPSGNTVSSGIAFPSIAIVGDLCIRTDENKTYAYNGTDWVVIVTSMSGATYIESVNGKTGSAISLTKSDLSLGNVTNDKQMKAVTGAIAGQIPVWANTTDLLSVNGYNVITSFTATPSNSNIPTEKAIKTLIDAIPSATVDITPLNAGIHAISSGWAYSHETNAVSNVKHLTDAQVSNLHAPITISGIGLVINGQQLGLSIGSGATQVARGDHGHGEYALKTDTAPNSLLLNGKSDTMFAPSVHVHAHGDLQNAGSNTHAQIDTFIASKGIASGLASLGADGKIPASQLPASVLSGLDFKGVYTGTTYPASPDIDDFYIISSGCTINGIVYNAGDFIIYNGSTWDSISIAPSVISVDGKTGEVDLSNVYATYDHSHKLTELSDVDGINPVHAQYIGFNAYTHKHEYFSIPNAPESIAPIETTIAAKNAIVTFADVGGKSIQKSNVTIVENRMFNVIIDGGNLDLV